VNKHPSRSISLEWYHGYKIYDILLLLPLLIFTSLSAVVRARGTPLSGSCSMPTRASTVTSQDSGTVVLELSCSVPSFDCCFFPFFFSVMWRCAFLGLSSPSVPFKRAIKITDASSIYTGI